MSAISDKLLYLDVTRSKIKDTINYTGAGITESDTFRSYARTLKDSFVDIINDGTATLYDNFPKATDEGSDTTLTNVYEAPMTLEVEGKSEQDSYSGKNYANTNKDPDWVYQNTVWTRSGSNVTVKNNGTNSYAFVEYYVDNLKPNTVYTISMDAVANENGYIRLSVGYPRDTGGVTSLRTLNTSNKTAHLSTQFTTPSDTSNLCIMLYSVSGTYHANAETTYSNIQIEEGSSETSYEPYVGGTPSPNPDYPQEIKSVSGIGNLYDKNTMPLTNGLWSGGGKITSNGSGWYVIVPITGGKTYTISKKNVGRNLYATTTNVYPAVGVSVVDSWTGALDINTLKIETSSNANYLFIGLYAGSSITDEEKQKTMEELQIEEGNTAHTPVPYGHWLPVKVSNKNLFDGELELGTISSTGVPTASDSVIRSKYFTKVANSISISYENGPTGIVVYGYDKNYNFITALTLHTTSTTGLENAIIVNIPENIEYIKFRFNTGFTTTSIKVQIEENSTATDYIEHQEQTTLIDLNKYDENNNIIGNYELCSARSTKDLLNIKDGSAVITQNISSVIFNGTNIVSVGNYKGIYSSNMPPNKIAQANVGLVYERAKFITSERVENTIYENSGNVVAVGAENDTLATLQEKFNGGLLYYVLATPETITLRGTYNVKTYEDVTHISIDDNLEPNMIASGLTWE